MIPSKVAVEFGTRKSDLLSYEEAILLLLLMKERFGKLFFAWIMITFPLNLLLSLVVLLMFASQIIFCFQALLGTMYILKHPYTSITSCDFFVGTWLLFYGILVIFKNMNEFSLKFSEQRIERRSKLKYSTYAFNFALLVWVLIGFYVDKKKLPYNSCSAAINATQTFHDMISFQFYGYVSILFLTSLSLVLMVPIFYFLVKELRVSDSTQQEQKTSLVKPSEANNDSALLIV